MEICDEEILLLKDLVENKNMWNSATNNTYSSLVGREFVIENGRRQAITFKGLQAYKEIKNARL